MAATSDWSLRRRLVVAIVGLLAAVSVIIGAVSTLALRGYLLERLDAQLVSAAARFERAIDGPGSPRGGQGDPGDFLPAAGLPPGTIGAFLIGGTLTAAVLGTTLESTQLELPQVKALLGVPRDGSPVTVNLGGEFGEYRFIASTNPGGDLILTGMPLSDVNSTVLQLVLVIALVSAGGLLAASITGTAIVRLALRPLDRVVATASHVAELPLDKGEVALAVRVPEEDAQPTTEVGQVGAAINRMLGHISAAFQAREASEKKVRTFVADASHELRTPLASIRGYAELTRRSGHELPSDVAHALSRIESESVRMTSLVEDLLLLARLDDGRSLESDPVDLRRVLADAVSDARAAGQDHEWELDVPAEPVTVNGDAGRLQQVVANLLTNARVHTPAGTRVVVSARVAGDFAELLVVDDGPGVDPKVLPSVFERFTRADSSRSRAAGSTGLGLAIVSAVIAAHGGTVDVRSEPGATSFIVRIPLGQVVTE